MNNQDTISSRILKAMNMRGLKQADLVKLTGIGKSSISQYISGQYLPKQNNIYSLAKALNVSEAWLMGYDVPMERQYITSTPPAFDIFSIPNISPVKKQSFPILGNIACGEPCFAEQDHEGCVDASGNLYADFCLRAKGDSMINARIYDGDIVFIRQQPDVEDGDIAAVLIDDEATLKRVYKMPGRIQLRAENPNYEPLNYTEEDYCNIRILGKAVAFQSDIK